MIITLCGSTRFAKEYEFWNLLFTLEGHIVLSCAVMAHSKNISFERKQKSLLDIVHLQKIELSDAIFVIDPNGYIGESTEREIIYAEQTGKSIYILTDQTTSANGLILFFIEKSKKERMLLIDIKKHTKVEEMLGIKEEKYDQKIQ